MRFTDAIVQIEIKIFMNIYRNTFYAFILSMIIKYNFIIHVNSLMQHYKWKNAILLDTFVKDT